MKVSEIRKLSKEDLEKKEKEMREGLMQDRQNMSAGTPPKSPGLMRERRKTIARIKTIHHE